MDNRKRTNSPRDRRVQMPTSVLTELPRLVEHEHVVPGRALALVCGDRPRKRKFLVITTRKIVEFFFACHEGMEPRLHSMRSRSSVEIAPRSSPSSCRGPAAALDGPRRAVEQSQIVIVAKTDHAIPRTGAGSPARPSRRRIFVLHAWRVRLRPTMIISAASARSSSDGSP